MIDDDVVICNVRLWARAAKSKRGTEREFIIDGRCRRRIVSKFFGKFVWAMFGIFWLIFGGPWGGPGPTQGSQNGPRDPGDRFKIQKKNFKNLGWKCQLFLKS